MNSTKLEEQAKNGTKSYQMQLMKVTKDGTTVEVEAPYCTAEEWARRTKMTLDEVKKGLYERRIAAYQLSSKGRLFVNVIAETKRLMEQEEWR